MRIKEPKTTALIFKSGKLVCTGAKTVRDSRLASLKFKKILEKLGNKVDFKNFTVQNIVANVDVKFKIKLQSLHTSFLANISKCSTYDSETFPGLIYKYQYSQDNGGTSKGICFLIFSTGKIVITGAKVRTL